MKNESTNNFLNKYKIELITLPYLGFFLITGLFMQPFSQLLEGLINIFTAPGVLLTDYILIAGLGPALVNASLVGFLGYFLLIFSGATLNGLSVAAIYTLFGFGLFGKTIWSILPIMLGVFIYSRLSGQSMATNVYAALFGTALAPFVTQTAFGFRLGLIPGILIGIIAGFLVAPIAKHAFTFHQGYNLYNIGFASGLVGLLILSILRAFNLDSQGIILWSTEYDDLLRILVIGMFAFMLGLGAFLSRTELLDYKKILKHAGRPAVDFTEEAKLGHTLINMALVGLIGVVYIELVNGNYNGPSLGGLYTMVGFAAFGKHPFNVTPIMLGVWLATAFSIYSPADPGPMVAALFGTALAPVAGDFGPKIGILAGIIHLFIVTQIGVVHGGLNLYNNGFSAGFVAAIFLAFKKDFSLKKRY